VSQAKPGTKIGLLSDGIIWAIPYRDKKPLPPVSLSDGVIVGYLTPEAKRQHFPEHIPGFIVVRTDDFGKTQTVRLEPGDDESSFRPRDVFVLEGIYELPSDDVAAVYYDRSRPIDRIE
jgi:hypothetical protein